MTRHNRAVHDEQCSTNMLPIGTEILQSLKFKRASFYFAVLTSRTNQTALTIQTIECKEDKGPKHIYCLLISLNLET